jgi:hypothetical protein
LEVSTSAHKTFIKTKNTPKENMNTLLNVGVMKKIDLVPAEGVLLKL